MKPIDRFAEFFAGHRLLIGGLIVTVSLVTLCGYFDEPSERSSRTIRQPDSQRQLLDEVSEEFEQGGGIDCFIVVDGDDLFTDESVTAIRRFVKQCEELDEVASVIWVDKFPVFNEYGFPEPLLLPEDFPLPAFQEDFDYARERALEHPLINGQLMSDDAKTMLMPVVFRSGMVKSKRELTTKLGEMVTRSDQASDLQFRLTGNWPLRYAERDVVDGEKLKFQLIGYGLIFLISAILFRSLSAVLIVAGAPVLGVFWTLGILGLMNEEHNGLADAILPILVTMVGFTDGVHLMEHIRKSRAAGASRLEASKSAIRQLGLPCALTSLTTAIGFGSLMVAESDVVNGFGRACSIGVVATFVAVITVIPLLSSTRLANRVHAGYEFDPIAKTLPRFEGLIRGTMRYSRQVTIAGIAVTACLIAVALTLRPDNKLEFRMPTETEAYQALAHCDEVFGGIQFLSVVVEWPESIDPSASEELVRAIADAERLLEEEPSIHNPSSILSVLRFMSVTPENLFRGFSYLESVSDELTRRYYRADKRRTLVVARIQDRGIARYEPVFARLDEQLAELEKKHPGFRFQLTGQPVVWGRELWKIVSDLATSLGLAAGVILVVMGIVYRSVRIGLITVVPNLFPLVVTAASMVALGRTLDLVSVCAFTICLGIAVDDTIHFVSRFQYELARDGDVSAAIRRSFIKVGTALIITTIVLISGFSSLLTSEMPSHRMFAGMCCSTIGAALIGDLILLPAMLSCFIRSDEPADTREPTAPHFEPAESISVD